MSVPAELRNPLIALGSQVFVGTLSWEAAVEQARRSAELVALDDEQLRDVIEETSRYWHDELERSPHVGGVYSTLASECADARLGAIGAFRHGAGADPAVDRRMAEWIGVAVRAILDQAVALLVIDNAHQAWELFMKAVVGARALPDEGRLRLREAVAAALGQREAARLGGADELEADAARELEELRTTPGREREADAYLRELSAELERAARARELFRKLLAEEEQGEDPPVAERGPAYGVSYAEELNAVAARVTSGELDIAQARGLLVAQVDYSILSAQNVYHLALLHKETAAADPVAATVAADLNHAVAERLMDPLADLTHGYAAEALGTALLTRARGGETELFDRALESLSEALAEIDTPDAAGTAANIVQKIALCRRGLGDFEGAADSNREAIERWEAMPPSRERLLHLAESVGNLADAQEKLGAPSAAFDGHLRALDLFLEVRHLHGVRQALNHIARVATEAGRSDDVLAASERAAAVMAELADIHGAVETYFVAARHALRTHRHDAFLHLLQRAEDLLLPQLQRSNVANEYLPLEYELLIWRGVVATMLLSAESNRAEGLDEAYRAFDGARAIAARMGDHDRVAGAIVQIGKLLLRAGEYAAAEDAVGLVEHVPCGEEYRVGADEVRAMAALGSGRFAVAARALEDVSERWGERQPDRQMAAAFRAGEAWESAGELTSAVAAYERSLELFESLRLALLEESRVELGATVEEAYARLILLLGDAGSGVFDPARAFEWLERSKSRTFVEALGLARLPLHAPADAPERDALTEEASLLERVNGLRDELVLGGAADRLRTQAELRRCLEELESVWERLQLHHPEYVALRRGRTIEWGDVRELVRA